MPSLRRGRRGDQRVLVNVLIPHNLNAEQRELLERFAETLGDHNLVDEEERESLFHRVRRAFG
jgi:molecular chaperone DnaJ